MSATVSASPTKITPFSPMLYMSCQFILAALMVELGLSPVASDIFNGFFGRE
ncbi:hypothetical protein LTY57_06395 [Limosilactobacillus balticus]|nr:hypothetical protein [Limosilactobacillus balticus]